MAISEGLGIAVAIDKERNEDPSKDAFLVRLRASAKRGVQYLEAARNADAVWRYRFQPGDNDSSVTGWCVMALKSAEHAGIRVDERIWPFVIIWYDHVTNPKTGWVDYMKGASGSIAMTAVGVYCRLLAGASRRDPLVIKGARYLVKHMPSDRENLDYPYYYWYYGSLCLYRIGTRLWSRWNAQMMKTLLAAQRKKGCARGSWDPAGVDGEAGGRVYATAIACLTLEVYYRYPRVFK